MSVIKITEDRNREASMGLQGIETTRVFQVTFDNADDPEKRPLLALNGYDGTLAVPRIYSVHPGDSWLYVKNKTAKTIGPFDYEVTVYYGWPELSQNSEGEPYANPLEQEPEISWTFDVTNEQIDRDIYGKPILNSSQESFINPVTETVCEPILHIRRNEAGYNAVFAESIIDHVNSDNFFGFAPGLVLCKVFSGDRMRAANLVYWAITYEFHFRTKTVGGINYGWLKRIMDEGYRIRKGIDSNGKTIYEELKDENGIKLSQPRQLDGEGNLLSDDCKLNPFWNEWITKYSANFSLLGLE
jgi:hypothetical protein